MPVPTPHEFESAGLYDPDDPSTPGRLELLEWLAEEGFTIAEMRDANETGALGAMAGDRWLLPYRRLTRAEALDRCGLAEDDFDAYVTALGMVPVQGAPPGEIGYTDGDIELLGVVDSVGSIFTPAEALAFFRVIGSAVARMADAAVSMFLTDVEATYVREGRSEFELGRTVKAAVQLVDGMGARLDPLLRRHMLQAIERTRATTIDEQERFEYRYGVGFVDLVGFTSLSGNLSARELAGFIGRFEGRAHDVVAAAGARVVKLIGDEVMFVAADANALCRAGQALIAAFSDDGDDVVPRGGMAFGNVVPRGGDYYGSIVNLASRLADEAVPRELLVSDELARAATDCAFEPAGRRMVKGFDEPVSVRSMLAV